MDLIGSIQYIESRLGGHKSNQGRKRSAQKNTRTDAPDEKKEQADARQFSSEYDARLGRKVDTTA